MIQSHIGEITALLTVFCWAIATTFFELGGKKVGSLPVNLIRLIIAFFLLGLYTFITRGMFLPVDASYKTWIWLSISGLVGFVFGDLFLFQAFVEIGARLSMLIMAFSPPLTAILGYILMGEIISLKGILGMCVTICGISMVILIRDNNENKITFSYSIKGIGFAFLGSVGQSLGLTLSKFGMGNYNAFSATQIRVISGAIGISIFITYVKKWGDVKKAFNDIDALKKISVGATFGPFIGVSLSLLAIQYAPTGVVMSITSIVPVAIIPFSVIFLKEKITLRELTGAIIAVIGVILLF